MPIKAAIILGTRPELIKLAPVITAMRENPKFEPFVLSTGQHREMLDQAMSMFGIVADLDLDLMSPNQSLIGVLQASIEGIGNTLVRESPDVVLVQGDTTTALSGAQVGYFMGIPVGHVEAGLRSGNINAPFPEEMNRILISRLAKWHFAPTELARDNLLAESVSSEAIHITGNTVVDSLKELTLHRAREVKNKKAEKIISKGSRLILVTLHRRESFGGPIEGICQALAEIVNENQNVELLFPVHLNPKVREVVNRILGGNKRVHLTDPLDYVEFIGALRSAYFVITDSGGVQEEAPIFGVPVLLVRETTERIEGVDAGVVCKVGFNPENLLSISNRLLANPDIHLKMSKQTELYGDGNAADRIVEILSQSF